MCNIAVVGQESISGVYAERGIAKFDIKTFFIYTFTDYLEKKDSEVSINRKDVIKFPENRTKIQSHVNSEPH